MAAGVAVFLIVAALSDVARLLRSAGADRRAMSFSWRVSSTRQATPSSTICDRALQVKLAESPFLSLLPEAAVRQPMRSMRHQPDERVTQELGIEICKRQGLKAVVVPEIDAIGSYYLITLEAIDAQSGKPIARQPAGNRQQRQSRGRPGKSSFAVAATIGRKSAALCKSTMRRWILPPRAPSRRCKPTGRA